MSQLFKDQVFPADDSSLCFHPHEQKPEFVSAVYSWRRPHEWTRGPTLFLDGAAPGDVEQGELGDCWLLSAFSVVALYPALLRKLFVLADPKQGKYIIRLYKDGKWKLVTIDDRIPCNREGYPAFGHNTNKSEIWVVILEKAVAKLLGSYEALHGGYLEEGIALLTGGRPERIYINNWKQKQGRKVYKEDRLWQKLLTYNNEKVMMGCCISSGKEQKDDTKGLVAGHAYAIIDVRMTNDRKYRLIKLRNPWGFWEWKGAFSDRSSKWTYQYRKELKHEAKEDGMFWMTFPDFCRIFDRVTTCRIFNDSLLDMKSDETVNPIGVNVEFPCVNWNHERVEGEWDDATAGGSMKQLGFAKNPRIDLKIYKSARCFMIITQAFLQENADAQYYRTGIGFVIQRGLGKTTLPEEDSEDALFQFPVFGRFNAIELELEKGEYTITPCTLYPNRKGKFRFELYSPAEFELRPSEDHELNTVKTVPPSARREKKEETVVKPKKEEDEDSLKSTVSSFLTTYQFEFGGFKPGVK